MLLSGYGFCVAFPFTQCSHFIITLHSSMWMPVARPSLSILFTAFGSRCPNLTVCATCVCNSDDLFPTLPRLPFQFYAYTVTCISYFQASQQPTVFRSFL